MTNLSGGWGSSNPKGTISRPKKSLSLTIFRGLIYLVLYSIALSAWVYSTSK